MTPALTETVPQGPGAHLAPSFALQSLNSDTIICMDNSQAVEHISLPKANGPKVADKKQLLKTEFMNGNSIGSQTSGHYQTVFLLTSNTALSLPNKGSSTWKMENQDVCKQRFHITKGSPSLPNGMSYQPERKAKRELFPGCVSQLLADVHKLWDVSLTKTQGTEGICLPECMLNGHRGTESLAVSSCPSLISHVSANVPSVASVKAVGTNLLLKCLNHQQVLLNRARRNQKRLQSYLAQHAVQHFNQQIRAFVNHQIHDKPAGIFDSQPTKVINNNLNVGSSGISSATSDGLKNGVYHSVKRFSVSAKEILKQIKKDFDSDATGSSSDEDWDEKARQNSDECNAERSWLSVRTRIGSRWVWLQSQISELEYKIQHLTDLHSQIRKAKGTLKFEEPSKGNFKQKLWLPDSEMLLSLAERMPKSPQGTNPSPTNDLDMSPSSPTLLLRNIEKQSARLTEIVSSLTVPLLSPNDSAKSSVYKRVANGFSDRMHTDGFPSFNEFCEQQVKRRKKVRVKASSALGSNLCSSARTRPLQALKKRKLYKLSAEYSYVNKVNLFSSPVYQYEELPSNGNHCSTWKCSKVLHRPWLMAQNACEADSCFHPVLSFPYELPLNVHLAALPMKNHNIKGNSVDSIALRGELDKSQSYDAALLESGLTTPVSTQKSSAQQLLAHESSSMVCAARRRLRSGNSYDINNIVIPMSLIAPTKLEKLKYKEIITPSWKEVVLEPLESPAHDMPEDLSDEAYISRHEKYELKEKARWSLWDHSKRPKRNRSSSYSFGTSPRTVLLSCECSCSPNSQAPSEALPSDTGGYRTLHFSHESPKGKTIHWERRVFPLTEEPAMELLGKCPSQAQVSTVDNQQCPKNDCDYT
uniref:KAT8 regulatory NSL complex subunit 1-like protein n=1 Tax=Xenopus tropicalis TaxID=8364 RepID=A0A803JK58_XENTR